MASEKSKKKRDVLGGIWVGSIAVLMLLMLYGVIRFPYPISYRDGGYYNTQRQQATEEQYRSQKAFERVLWCGVGLAALVAVTLAIRDHGKKKRR
jgi:hypothetical protein